jgi:hypothetical protein
VLRARLVLDAGTLYQVSDRPGPTVEVLDLPDADDSQQQTHIRRLSRQPFDLETGPLTRITLLRLSATEHVLVWIAHHAILDGWSFGLILQELQTRYQAAVTGAAKPASNDALQYPDVAAWQRERLTGGEFDAPLARWRDRLAGADIGPIPTDHPRPPAQTFDGDLIRFAVPAQVTAELRALADRSGVTVFSAMLATFGVLTARQSGRPSAVVGVPLSGRGRPELDKVLGPLSNTLPIRLDLTPRLTFQQAVTAVNGAVLDAIGDQDVPFDRLVEQLSAGRDPSRNPIFDVLFNMGNLPQAAAGGLELGPGVQLSPSGQPNGTIRMDLELTMEDAAGSLHGRLEYNTALFEPTTAVQLVALYQRLLATLAEAPDTTVDALLGPDFGPRPATRTPAPAQPAASSRMRRGASWADSL